MPVYGTALDIWSPNPSSHDDLTFQINTSPSVFSRRSDPIVRITPTPPPLGKDYTSSVRTSAYAMTPRLSNRAVPDDPAFSTDPRLNPHFVPEHGQPFTSPSYSVEFDSTQSMVTMSSRSSASSSSPSYTPPAASLSNESLSQKSDAAPTSRQTPPTPPVVPPSLDPPPSGSLPAEERLHRKPGHRPRSRDLDKIDELDESDPFGSRYHHYGPYQTANDALVGRNTSLHRNDTMSGRRTRALHRIPHQPPMPIGTSINLVPGQIFPKMPYQPPPPDDYLSPPPTSAPLIPDRYPYDIPSLPHLPPPHQYANIDESSTSASVPAPTSHYMHSHTRPIPRHSNSNSHSVSPPFSPQKRHSFSGLPPSDLPPSHQPPRSIRRPPSMLATENTISRLPHYEPSAPSIRRAPSFDSRMPPPPPPDISVPPASSRHAPHMKPAPLHLPKKLVMPTPLQNQLQTLPNYSATNDKHERKPSFVRQRQDQSTSHGHRKQQPLLMPKAQNIPMIPDERDARHLLRRKTTAEVNGVVKEVTTYSRPSGDPAKTHGREKAEKPAKMKTGGGLFGGGDKLGSKLVRKLSKMK